MSLALRHENHLTWNDYRQWPVGERWEIIDGIAHAMSPSPSYRHQSISSELHRHFSNFLHGKKCKAIAAPMDVKLCDSDILQPDLLVVCDPSQIKETHVDGAPRLVVEIVSPSSESRDRIVKMKLYEMHGVQEYWIVTPYPPMVEIFTLESCRLHLHSGGTIADTVVSPSFPGLEINLMEVFDLPYTEEERKIFEVREPPPSMSVMAASS